MSRPRVVVVDDHRLFRAGVISELGDAVEVVGEAHDVESAVAVGFATCHELPCWRVATGLCHRDAVQGSVELPVACAAEAVPGAVRRPDRQRCGAVVAGVGGCGAEP